MAYQTKQQQAVLRCLQLRAEECLSAASTNTVPRLGIPMTAFCCGVRAVAGWSIWTAGTWRRSAAICPPNTTFALTPAAPY